MVACTPCSRKSTSTSPPPDVPSVCFVSVPCNSCPSRITTLASPEPRWYWKVRGKSIDATCRPLHSPASTAISYHGTAG